MNIKLRAVFRLVIVLVSGWIAGCASIPGPDEVFNSALDAVEFTQEDARQAKLDREEVRRAIREDREVDRAIYHEEREAERETCAAERGARVLQARRDNKDVINIDLGLGITQEYEVVGKFVDVDELVKKQAHLDKLNTAIDEQMAQAERVNREKYLEELEAYIRTNRNKLQARSGGNTGCDCAQPQPTPLPVYQALKPPVRQGIRDEDITWTIKLKSKSRIQQHPSVRAAQVRKLPAKKAPCVPTCQDCAAACQDCVPSNSGEYEDAPDNHPPPAPAPSTAKAWQKSRPRSIDLAKGVAEEGAVF